MKKRPILFLYLTMTFKSRQCNDKIVVKKFQSTGVEPTIVMTETAVQENVV